jgi:tetratricopeptide (TPR) repeat protein
MRIGKQDEAIKSFKDYLDAGGNSYDASLNLAHTLDIEGQKTEAMKYYGLAINQARDVLPVQAVSAMVHLLISQGQYKTALQQIDEFYAADDSAKGYLNTEHAQLLAKVAETEPVQATAPSVALDAPAADLTADAVAVMATDRNPASNPTAEKHAESQKP